ncbi:hypothetical protein GW750_06525 [bacterium]|nr:hypothetical protein [bacterium]
MYQCRHKLLADCLELKDLSQKKQQCEFLLRSLDILAQRQSPPIPLAINKLQDLISPLLDDLRNH